MKPAIVVSGFGRCGTSMVMQMLAAGGVPCLGEAPAYEDPRGKITQWPDFWRGEAAGRAIKVLDPHRPEVGFPPAAYASIIWMHRDPAQQAASLAKFGAMMLGVAYTRDHRRQMERGLARDRALVLRALAARQHLALSFEGVLRDPPAAAGKLAELVAGPFDIGAAARCVLPRSAQCQPGLGIELGLLQRERATA